MVIPDPPGHVNDIPASLTTSPTVENPILPVVITVAIPVDGV